MKKMILLATIAAILYVQNTFAQTPAYGPLQKVITSYLDVKNALTKDDPNASAAFAKTLSSDIHNVPMEKLTAGQHSAWMKYSEKLINDANLIGTHAELKEQRKQFAGLSQTFYKMLKAMKVNETDLFYQYCPMADAYWVSENSKIANPYYGKQMPSCGSTKETIKAQKP